MTQTRCHHRIGVTAVGDPVDVVTGALFDRWLDFTLDGPFPVRFYRHYDSGWYRSDRGLGLGMRHGFDHWLVWDLDGITYQHADGSEAHFRHFEDGQTEAFCAGYRLQKRDELRYHIARRGEPTLVFHRAPRAREAELVELFDPASDSQRPLRTVLHHEKGRLDRILAPGDETLKLEWTEEGRIARVVYWGRDGERSSMIEYRYDDRGCLVEGIDAYKQRFRFGYADDRRLVRATDRRGYSFLYEYDGEGRCIRSAGEDGLLGVTLEYRPIAFETQVLDANGAEWIYRYTPEGVVTVVTDPYGGRVFKKIGDEGQVVAEYDPKGAETKVRYDVAGAPIAKVTPFGDVIPIDAEEGLDPKAHRVPRLPIEWELGDLWEEDFGLPDAYEPIPGLPPEVCATLVTSEDPLRGRVRTVRDRQGLVLREESEAGHTRDYGYNENGGLRRVTDMDGHKWYVEHRSWNHVAKEVDPLGGINHYKYSDTEQLIEVIDPAGTETNYEYDLKDRLVAVRRGERAQFEGAPIRESYVYDEGDHLTEKRGADGDLLLTFKRDLKGQLLERSFASGERQTFEYDKHGRVVVARTLKHECTFRYDAYGRRVEDKRDGSGVARRFTETHLGEVKVLDRFRTEYRPETSGSVVITDPTGATQRIHAHGRGVFTRDLGCGLSETTQYHPRGGRVLGRVLYAKEGPHDARWERTYRYSGEGDLLEARDSERGLVRHQHDAALASSEASTPMVAWTSTSTTEPAPSFAHPPSVRRPWGHATACATQTASGSSTTTATTSRRARVPTARSASTTTAPTSSPGSSGRATTADAGDGTRTTTRSAGASARARATPTTRSTTGTTIVWRPRCSATVVYVSTSTPTRSRWSRCCSSTTKASTPSRRAARSITP